MTIFWVDDDIKFFTRPYVEELKDEGYEDKIAAFVEPDSALSYFKKHHADLSCAIIDLMLPTGERFSPEETELGTRTGKALITELQAIDEDIPIIILSVVRDRDIIEWVKEKGITYLIKSKTLPRDLLAKVQQLERKTIGSLRN